MATDDERHPLAGMRVLDLTDLRGALCARILADLGAEVLRVDAGPPPLDPSDVHRNANKIRTRVDLDAPGAAAEIEALRTGADVLIENLPTAERSRLGLDPARLATADPGLVHVALTDFGLTGPHADRHLEPLPAFAASGALHISGFPHLPPCWLLGHIVHDCASVFGAVGAVAALMARRVDGRGELVEVSAQEAGLSGLNPWSMILESYLDVNPFLPVEGHRNADAAYWVLPAADGWVRTVLGSQRQWDGFVKVLGEPEALGGEEWLQPGFRLQNSDVVRIVAEDRLTDRTRAQLFDESLEAGTTLGVIHRPSEYVDHPQTRARGFFHPVELPDGRRGPLPRAPWRLGEAHAPLRRVGEAEGDRPDWSTPSSWRPQGPEPDASEPGLLLDGVRVVEFGVAAVVPELCWILSELGADVVKVESEAHPDPLRQSGMGHINRGFAFNAECRGRRSVAIDLTTDEGRELALELCAGADVVAENHRGGVLDALGLGHDVVSDRNPGVVYVASQGYGRGGPYGEMQAWGPLNSGFAGVHHLWNHPDAPYPCGSSLNHPDHIAGKLAAVAVLAALDRSRRTGRGTLIDMAQTEAAAYLLGEVYLEAVAAGVDPEPLGNRSPTQAPHGVYPASGDDRWVAVAVPDDTAWQRLRSELGWPDDPALASAEGRLTVVDDLDARLAAWTSTLDADEVTARLQAVGVSAMTVQGPRDHAADAHLTERRFLVTTTHAEVGPERHVGNPLRFGRLPLRTAGSASLLGEHTAEVLTGVLGLDADRAAALMEAGVCR